MASVSKSPPRAISGRSRPAPDSAACRRSVLPDLEHADGKIAECDGGPVERGVLQAPEQDWVTGQRIRDRQFDDLFSVVASVTLGAGIDDRDAVPVRDHAAQ